MPAVSICAQKHSITYINLAITGTVNRLGGQAGGRVASPGRRSRKWHIASRPGRATRQEGGKSCEGDDAPRRRLGGQEGRSVASQGRVGQVEFGGGGKLRVGGALAD